MIGKYRGLHISRSLYAVYYNVRSTYRESHHAVVKLLSLVRILATAQPAVADDESFSEAVGGTGHHVVVMLALAPKLRLHT